MQYLIGGQDETKRWRKPPIIEKEKKRCGSEEKNGGEAYNLIQVFYLYLHIYSST